MSDRPHDLIVDALAVFRLTRLATTDTFPPVMHARWRLMRRFPDGSWPVELIECPWCMSFWIGLGVVVMRRSPWWRPVALALASSAVAGLLVEKG